MIGRSAADGWRYSSIMMNGTKREREEVAIRHAQKWKTLHENYIF